MSDQITEAERLDWVREARDTIRTKMRGDGLSAAQAYEATATARVWRQDDARAVLHEAYEMILDNISKSYGPSPHTELNRRRPTDAYVDGWYEGPDLENDIFWPPLRTIIERNLGEDALRSIDDSSTKILREAQMPSIPELRQRGLVVGYVQSGKTTNFMSVIAKAADAGFRLIIVLTGTIESLRRQTQKRLEDQLMHTTESRWSLLTTDEKDFEETKNAAQLANPDIRFLAVVKKNRRRLEALNDWIDGAGDSALSCPILVIDDEADQASINVQTSAKDDRSAIKNDRSAINRLIGDLLRRNRTSYIAYTATPFANILIDPNDSQDLYPKDFIHVLPMPEGYFGTEQVFGRDALPSEDPDEISDDVHDIIREIPEDELNEVRPPSRNIEAWNPAVPESLSQAIRWFLLATAEPAGRGDAGKHSSMLIHTSSRTDAHEALASEVDAEIRSVREGIRTGRLRDALRTQWESETGLNPLNPDYGEPLSFDQVWEGLPDVAGDLETIIDNGTSEERLDYEAKIRTVIAVGGNTLSRGLTLEGLVCSYFARSSRTYDTLLQMGRWFGFRRGYEDLVRIWMPGSLSTWYHDLATVEEDLRRDIARYEFEGLTPQSFQARVRTHPAMQVTSATRCATPGRPT